MAEENNKQVSAADKAGEIAGKTIRVFREAGGWAYKLRSVILAIPVIIGAIWLAVHNSANLPEIVGLDLQANGEYAILIDRSIAVAGPLAVTAVCLLMMFISRRVVYPWLISIFSLALPLLIYITNVFPA